MKARVCCCLDFPKMEASARFLPTVLRVGLGVRSTWGAEDNKRRNATRPVAGPSPQSCPRQGCCRVGGEHRVPDQGRGHEALPSITAPSSPRCPTEDAGLWRAGPLLASFCARSPFGYAAAPAVRRAQPGSGGLHGTARHGPAAALAFSSARA